jgi:hypothetical protein
MVVGTLMGHKRKQEIRQMTQLYEDIKTPLFSVFNLGGRQPVLYSGSMFKLIYMQMFISVCIIVNYEHLLLVLFINYYL